MKMMILPARQENNRNVDTKQQITSYAKASVITVNDIMPVVHVQRVETKDPDTTVSEKPIHKSVVHTFAK